MGTSDAIFNHLSPAAHLQPGASGQLVFVSHGRGSARFSLTQEDIWKWGVFVLYLTQPQGKALKATTVPLNSSTFYCTQVAVSSAVIYVLQYHFACYLFLLFIAFNNFFLKGPLNPRITN